MPDLLSICFLWHFHQPQYQDLTCKTALLPWARLHCARNYSMMLELLEEQPAVHATINITPVLATQLDAYAHGRSTDEWLELASTPVARLDMDQRARLVALFFDVNRERIIDTDIRYAELYRLRGKPTGSWTESELRDLQCKFILAWTCYADLQAGLVDHTLLASSRDYTEKDRIALVEAQQKLVQDFIPRLAKLCRIRPGRTGDITVRTSYHPTPHRHGRRPLHSGYRVPAAWFPPPRGCIPAARTRQEDCRRSPAPARAGVLAVGGKRIPGRSSRDRSCRFLMDSHR